MSIKEHGNGFPCGKSRKIIYVLLLLLLLLWSSTWKGQRVNYTHGPTQEISWQQLDDAVCEVKYPTLQNEQSEHAHFQFDVNDMEKVLNLTKESGSTCFLKEGTHLCYSS